MTEIKQFLLSLCLKTVNSHNNKNGLSLIVKIVLNNFETETGSWKKNKTTHKKEQFLH